MPNLSAPPARRVPFILLVAAPVVAAFGLYYAVFGHLFLLAEYREWLTFPMTLYHVNLGAFDWSYGSNRMVPLYASLQIGRVCHDSFECNNVLLLLVMLLAVALMAAAIGAIDRWRHPVAAAISAGFVLFSEPFINAASWQATILDRLAGLFCAAAILAYAVTLRSDLARRVVIGNTVVLLCVGLAYNSKEAAWGLVPSLFLLGFMTESHGGWWRSIGRSLATLALPIAYVTFKNLALMASRIGQPFDEHNFGGNPAENLAAFTRAFLNTQGASETAVTLAVVAIACAAGIWAAKRDGALTRIAIWSAASFVLSLLPPLATLFGAPFYLIIPGLFLMGILYVVFCGAFAGGTSAVLRGVAALVVGAICLHHLVGFKSRLDFYARIGTQSANFVAAFPVFAAAACGRAEPVTALYPKRNDLGYMFFQGGPLGRYVCGAGPQATTLDAGFKFAAFKNEPGEVARDGSIRIIFDDAMRLASVER